jgi:DNA-binding transcriptional ArsR family regulator
MSRYPTLRAVLPVDHERARHCAEVLKAVAHPLRLRIIAILCQGEENVNALAARLGEPQAIVSQQLRILRLRGLVAPECRDGFSIYRLTEPALRDLVGCMERCRVQPEVRP